MKMSNASEERFLIDRGTDAKRASRTSWGEESYVKVASTLSNNAHSMTQFMNPGGRLDALAVFRPGPLSRWRAHTLPALQASDRSSRPCRRTGICRVLFRGAPFSSLWRGSESHRFALRDCPTHDTHQTRNGNLDPYVSQSENGGRDFCDGGYPQRWPLRARRRLRLSQTRVRRIRCRPR